MISVRARWALAALVLLLLPAMFQALAIGLAAWHARVPQDYLVAAARASAVYEPAAQAYAEHSLTRALWWRPHDAALLELDARLALHRADSGDESPAARAVLVEHAIVAAQSATLRRPQWPYGWLVLAAGHAARGERSDAWADALVNAARLGPNETRVHAALAREYLRRGARSDARVADVLAQGFARALQRAPQQWVDAADRAGIGADVCARPNLPGTARERCVQLGWLSVDAVTR